MVLSTQVCQNLTLLRGRAVFRLSGRPVVVSNSGGGIHILGRHFHIQSPWVGSSESGIFSLGERPVVVEELRGGICILGAVLTWLGGWELRGRHFSY